MKNKILIFSLIAFLFAFSSFQKDFTADEIIEKANDNRYGETSRGKMKMTIKRPKWSRTVEMKIWTKGDDYSMVYISAPAKEKGQVFLKRKNEMWNYIPNISRLIKLPPSMMSQGWMGSDYTNDDIMNESSIVDSYKHKILASEKIDGIDCYKIESVPMPESNIVWGKKITWISKDDFLVYKVESYDEDMYLVKTETSSNVKMMNGRKLPTKFTIIPDDKPGNITIVEIVDIEFDIDLDEAFFSKQNMKRVR
jgi:outer membrane lipoprotein-sorting protein